MRTAFLHAKQKGSRTSASLHGKRCCRSEPHTQTHAELAFVEALARQTNRSLGRHERPRISDAARGLVDRIGITETIVWNVEVRVVREVERLSPELHVQPLGDGR